jgi:hypothetical protein
LSPFQGFDTFADLETLGFALGYRILPFQGNEKIA